MKRVLVIKLGALGDFAQAFHAFAAIRAHHAGDHVALLTTSPFRALGDMMPWVDAVRLDPKAPRWNLRGIRRTAAALQGFDFVYDLQTSRRSNRYFRVAGRPPWSGIARGCSHPHRNPARDAMHTVERQREQLQMAGLTSFPVPDLDWLIRRGVVHGVEEPYALVMPGGGGSGAKRWPSRNYARLAQALAGAGLMPVVIGGAPEKPLAAAIRNTCPAALDLTGRTSIPDIAALASHAAIVVGNDTGPLQLAAKTGARTLALYSAATVPEQTAPRGPKGEWATIIRETRLADLPAERVVTAVLAALNAAARDTPRASHPAWPAPCSAPAPLPSP